MLYYDRIDISEGINIDKSNNSKKLLNHCWFFNHGFKFQDSVCNGYHDLLILCLDRTDISIITVKCVDYRCIIHDIIKLKAIYLLENTALEDRG